MVLPEYKPEDWKSVIQTTYKSKYEQSLTKLQKFENLGEQEAEQKLMNLLLKSSLIDRFLTLYGEQTAEELYAKINEHVQENPFTSADDLHEFASYMCHLFIMSKQTKRFRNSGLGYRLFCQYIRERVESGDIVNNETISQIFGDFYLTINVPPASSLQQMVFKKREVHLDFINIPLFAEMTTGFSYNEGKLSYDSDTVSLPLLLPVLAYTVDTDDKNRSDKSRTIGGRAKLRVAQSKIKIVVVEIYGDELVEPLTGIVFLKTYPDDSLKEMLKSLYYHVKGHIRPNGSEQVCVTEFTLIGDPTAPSLCSPEEKTISTKALGSGRYANAYMLQLELEEQQKNTFKILN